MLTQLCHHSYFSQGISKGSNSAQRETTLCKGKQLCCARLWHKPQRSSCLCLISVQRDPKKRKVKLVQKHLQQVNFDVGNSEEDSDFDIGRFDNKGIFANKPTLSLSQRSPLICGVNFYVCGCFSTLSFIIFGVGLPAYLSNHNPFFGWAHFCRI